MRRAIDWFFRDRRTGAIVVGQWPNAPLWLFVAAALSAWPLDPSGTAGSALRLVAGAALLAWALDELVRGVNPWRRCLGAAGTAYALWRLLGAG